MVNLSKELDLNEKLFEEEILNRIPDGMELYCLDQIRSTECNECHRKKEVSTIVTTIELKYDKDKIISFKEALKQW